jgi:hypothetical protein
MSRKKALPAPLRDAGVVTNNQPHLIAHLILRGVIGLVASARRPPHIPAAMPTPVASQLDGFEATQAKYQQVFTC